MKWQNDGYPPDGTWCWVTDGEEVWPAKRESGWAMNGWTNTDTWEDFWARVTHWIPLERPEAPEAGVT